MGREMIDLKPYIEGKRTMNVKCTHKDCKERKDVTKEYISCEQQNNKRRLALGDKFNTGTDELVLNLMGWTCEKHKWDKCWVCQYCHDAQFQSDFDLTVHQIICKEMQKKPKDENAYDYLRRIDWRKKF